MPRRCRGCFSTYFTPNHRPDRTNGAYWCSPPAPGVGILYSKRTAQVLLNTRCMLQEVLWIPACCLKRCMPFQIHAMAPRGATPNRLDHQV
eukprot:scaffold967_cov321-Pavlova_lutheri.AAC.35